MGARDLHSNIVAEIAISPASLSATTVGSIHDMQGYDALDFVILSGTVTTGDLTPLVEHGDDPALADAAAVPDSQLLPTGTGQEAARIFEDADDDTVVRLGYMGSKRYVRLTLTETGTAVALMAAIAIKSRAAVNPQAG